MRLSSRMTSPDVDAGNEAASQYFGVYYNSSGDVSRAQSEDLSSPDPSNTAVCESIFERWPASGSKP